MRKQYEQEVAEFLLACLTHTDYATPEPGESEHQQKRRASKHYANHGAKVTKLNQGGAEAQVVYQKRAVGPDLMYVVCRGTEFRKPPGAFWSLWYALSVLIWFARSDAVIDLFARMVKDTRLPGYVHAGFMAYSEAIVDDIKAIIEEKRIYGRELEICFIGHSLGGAMATRIAAICRKEIQGLRRDHVSLVTFGAPPVGNQLWADDVMDTIGYKRFRVVNGPDIIPRLKLHRLTSCLQGVPICHTPADLHYIDRTGQIEREATWFESLADRWSSGMTLRKGWQSHTRASYRVALNRTLLKHSENQQCAV